MPVLQKREHWEEAFSNKVSETVLVDNITLWKVVVGCDETGISIVVVESFWEGVMCLLQVIT